jgi:hypothetical protein
VSLALRVAAERWGEVAIYYSRQGAGLQGSGEELSRTKHDKLAEQMRMQATDALDLANLIDSGRHGGP